MSTYVVLPLALPLVTACVGLLLWKSTRAQAVVSVTGAVAQVAAAVALLAAVSANGVLAAHMGGWPAPYGIVLTADLLSAVMVLLTALLGFCAALTSVVEVPRRQVELGHHPLLHVMLLGVTGAFVTGDLFNLFVFFEVMLMGSFVLLALGGGRAQLEGTVKYVALNLFSSALFLIGAGFAYALARTLNFADLHRALPHVVESHPAASLTMAAFLLLAFSVKAGVFPVYFWLPASYHTASPAVSALFAGLLTKVGVYALLRLATVLRPASEPLLPAMLVIASLTMIFGVLGAVAQKHTRRILGFHILSQIGYMVIGVGLLSSPDPAVQRLGLAACVFYLAHHILVKTNLYLVAGTALRMLGVESLAQSGGLARRAPWLAAVFLVPAFSLAGLPPLSGFWAKLAVLRSGIDAAEWVVVTAAAVAGVLTLVSMLKIWNEVFWKDLPESTNAAPALSTSERWMRGIPIALLAAGTLSIGIWPAALYSLAERAADQLLDVPSTIEVVDPESAPVLGLEIDLPSDGEGGS